MKIDIITDEIGGIGGTSSAKFSNLVKGLLAKGIDVKLFGFKSKRWDNPSNLTTSIHFISKSTNSSIIDSFILFLKAPFLEIRKGSVIHTMRVVHALPFLSRRNPIIAEERGRATEEMAMRHSRLLISVYNLIEKICLRYVDKVIAVDVGTRQYLKQRYNIKEDKIVVIPIGVDLGEFKPCSEGNALSKYGIDRSKEVILFVGRIDPVKNLAMLLEAFRKVIERFRECNLVLVGKGREEDSLKKLAKKMGIADKVLFIGFVPHQDIPKIMSAADVFALTSLNEGSPNVTKEAIACGLPVVSTKVGDVDTYIKDGVNGYVVADFHPQEFAGYVVKALENRDVLQRGCLATRHSLSVETMVERYERVYQDVLPKSKTTLVSKR